MYVVMGYLRLISVFDHNRIVVCRQLEVWSEVRRWWMNKAKPPRSDTRYIDIRDFNDTIVGLA